jgi:hypothetical protein
MTTALRNGLKKAAKFAALATLVVAVGAMVPSTASAGGWGWGSFYNGPIYHAPSVHYHAVPHTTPHWTPWRGWHTHTHIDVVPHYTPGHYDYKHGNHVHGNPWFHNH